MLIKTCQVFGDLPDRGKRFVPSSAVPHFDDHRKKREIASVSEKYIRDFAKTETSIMKINSAAARLQRDNRSQIRECFMLGKVHPILRKYRNEQNED
jgi:hypothetical protein